MSIRPKSPELILYIAWLLDLSHDRSHTLFPNHGDIKMVGMKRTIQEARVKSALSIIR